MRHKLTRKRSIPALALASGAVFIAMLSGPASSPAHHFCTATSPGHYCAAFGQLSNGVSYKADWIGDTADGRLHNYKVWLKGQPRVRDYVTLTYNVVVNYRGGPDKQFERKATMDFRDDTHFVVETGFHDYVVISVQACRKRTAARSLCTRWSTFHFQGGREGLHPL